MPDLRRLADDVALLSAPNPGPMTLDGTNSYLLGRAGSAVAVVDPGPLEPREPMRAHRAQLLRSGPVSAVLLTHRHLDHSAAAAELAEQAGCGVRAADPAWQVGPDGLADGTVLDLAGTGVEVLAVPGHTADSVALLVQSVDGRRWLLTGDTVLGRGTTVITQPDGDLAAYLDSLQRLIAAVVDREVGAILPGHGPVLTDPERTLQRYLDHRLARLDQVRAARAAGDRTAAEVVARVYADVDRSLWPAAEQSVAAQLDYLDRHP